MNYPTIKEKLEQTNHSYLGMCELLTLAFGSAPMVVISLITFDMLNMSTPLFFQTARCELFLTKLILNRFSIQEGFTYRIIRMPEVNLINRNFFN